MVSIIFLTKRKSAIIERLNYIVKQLKIERAIFYIDTYTYSGNTFENAYLASQLSFLICTMSLRARGL